MDRANDQRRSPPNYNRPRDFIPHRANSYNFYPPERDNYGSSSHYMPHNHLDYDYQMREPQMPLDRYDEREEESQFGFRGQVPYGGNTRDQKPYGRPPISSHIQPYKRRPSYRGNSMHHQQYHQRPYSGPPFPPAASYSPPPDLFSQPPKIVHIPAYAPVLEEKLAQIREEGQRLREAELKLNESVRKSQRELDKSLWELEKVNHNTALATRQVETLCTKEEIEKIEKLAVTTERERELEILE
ncbi:15132_t:CDS:2 [Funneliformis geosporum]|uniref:19888_t:CDS:1 n=1 Tax=Funneliformis geosporum TaxID=1117311 RepID=A0A9W4SPI8_9GLOM|nr:15132_t:CDS:2 [Funneliformis geosporum]CAI2174508.1 19888_t:CDS:2 [Funneliformis geosporum]